MLPYAYYLLKVIICSAILSGYYWLALRNKIFHGYNRFYLLATVVLSLTLPLIKINFWNHSDKPTGVVNVLQTVSSGDEYLENVFITSPHKSIETPSWSAEQILPFIYMLVSALMLMVFIHALISIFIMLKKYPVKKVDSISFINTEAKGTPFSFLRYIFWNANIDMDTTAGKHIFKHEVAHIQERHTHDKLFINCVLILFWCNPFFWLIRKELNMIHEFIADKKAVEDSDTSAFAAMILQAAYPQHRFQLGNNFFYSPIKRRLLMLTKNSNPKVSYIGRILVLPLALFIFAAFTLKKEKDPSIYHGKKITVVIDAGHGGIDDGAIRNGLKEKDIAFAVANKIKALNSNADINIVLLRQSDIYISPIEKAKIAKENNADLFISLHCDAGPGITTRSGFFVWVSKNDNAATEKSKLFGSAMISSFIKNDYGIPVNDNLCQREKGIWVLDAAACPAIIIETGFISTPSDAQYIATEAGQQKTAENILKGIEQYLTADHIDAYPTYGLQPTDTVPKLAPVAADKPRLMTNPVQEVGKTPLYIVDGKEISAEEMQKIPAENLKTVSVLKDKQAVAKYGVKAKDGAVIIETKTVPLYIIDGKEIPASAINNMPSGNIASINILKDEKAVATYGDKAKNGVVLITTKNQVVETRDGVREVIVTGYPLEKVSPVYTTAVPKNDITEVTVTGYPLNAKNVTTDPVSVTLTGDNVIFTKVENEPSFPGGTDAWRKYLQEHLNAAAPVNEGWKAGTYTVIVQFIVKADGSVTDVKTTNYVGSATAKECIKIIANGPNWEPAVQNGKKVNAYRKQPITFVVEEENKIAVSANPELTLSSSSKPRLSIADFKKDPTLKINSGYQLVSTTVYFSGAGFEKVGTMQINSGNLATYQSVVDKCVAGTTITFDNVRVKTKDGIRTIDGKSFSLF